MFDLILYERKANDSQSTSTYISQHLILPAPLPSIHAPVHRPDHYRRRNTANQIISNASTMDMTMKPGAPSLTQPVAVRPRAGSSTSVDSGSESSGGVALSPTITRNATTSSSKRQPRPSKEARITLRNERLAAAATSAAARSEPSPVVATNQTANSSAQNPRPSKKARKALRKKQAAASASAGAQHEPAPVVTAGPTTTEAAANGSTPNPRLSKKARKALRKKTAAADAVAGAEDESTPVVTAGPTINEQTATSGSTRSFRLSKKARKTLRKREAAATAAASDPATDLHPSDAPDAAKNERSNDATESLMTITEAELNAIRATIEARYNALGTRLDERHAQQMAWAAERLRKHRFIFVVVFLMISAVFSLHLEAEERRRRSWW
jgi:hypothetical protein